MKKSLIIAMLLACTVFDANAQLKVASNGYIATTTANSPLSPISMNYVGNAAFYAAYYGPKRFIYVGSHSDNVCSSFVLDPIASSTVSTVANIISRPYTAQNTSALSIGSWSKVEGAPYAYAALGTITPNTGGAGVVGSANEYVPSVSMMGGHSYAGFFMGDVKSTGNLTVNGSIQGTILGASATASETNTVQAQTATTAQRVTDLLSQLEATTYSHGSNGKLLSKAATPSLTTIQLDDSISITMISEEEQNLMNRQSLAKTHYALDADQLEEVFPDLVYELDDGTKAINYMEIVPLLIESINELSSRLASLERGEVMMSPAMGDATKVSSLPAVNAVLKQNTPNPFTDQTKIRFQLTDDARSAFIYIFDMQGKLQKQIPVDTSMQSITIQGYELPAGMYLYSLIVNGQEVDTKRMILSK